MSIIEMKQFKNRIFREINSIQREEIRRSEHVQSTEHFLIIPTECPKSNIVYPEHKQKTPFKWMAFDIYQKYIKNGSVYEINLTLQTRMEMANLIDDRLQWEENTHYDDPVNV